jgi:hypothetical protein
MMRTEQTLQPELHPLLAYLDLCAPEPWMPPELHPFADTGVDSGVLALHIPAPERTGARPSIVAYYGDEGAVGAVLPLAEGLLAVAEGRAGFSGPGVDRGRLRVAADWARTLPTRAEGGYLIKVLDDRLSLAVPSATWSHRGTRPTTLATVVDAISDALAAGEAGSALQLGRNAAFNHPDPDDVKHVWGALVPVYQALNRPVYAEAARQRSE